MEYILVALPGIIMEVEFTTCLYNHLFVFAFGAIVHFHDDSRECTSQF